MSRMNIWIALLLASVLLNGVLIGVSARTWLSPSQPAMVTREGPPRGFDVRAFVEALPEAHREDARRRAQAERRALRGEFRAAGQARRQAFEALNAEPFDPQAAAMALDEARAARGAIEARIEGLILDVAADLTPQERRAALSAAIGPPRFRRGPDQRSPDREDREQP